MESKKLLDLRKVKAISDYQFGKDVTDILLNDINNIHIERSPNTNKVRYIYDRNILILTLRPTNGFFTLTLNSARKIIEKIQTPKLRAVVLNDISDFIKKGRNVFCKHVVEIDDDLRPLDETIVVNQNDELLAIGKLKLPVTYVKSFSSGIAIKIRRGIYKSKI
ncbi:MAG: PUA domain-containing protein [Promethearchaeota archaeon]